MVWGFPSQDILQLVWYEPHLHTGLFRRSRDLDYRSVAGWGLGVAQDGYATTSLQSLCKRGGHAPVLYADGVVVLRPPGCRCWSVIGGIPSAQLSSGWRTGGPKSPVAISIQKHERVQLFEQQVQRVDTSRWFVVFCNRHIKHRHITKDLNGN